MVEFFQTKVLPAVMKFVTSKPVSAIKDGMVATMSLTIIGSIFLLLVFFPYQPVADFFASSGLAPFMMQAFSATFNILALVVAFTIAYSYAHHAKVEALGCGIISMVSFILLSNNTVAGFDSTGAATQIGGVIPLSDMGSRGMVAAIIVGLVVGSIFTWFVSRGITIKMPAGVPQGVANAFITLIPGAVIIVLMAIVYGTFRSFGNTTFIDFIYKVIQTPLQGLTDSFGGVIFISMLVPILWWFGVHGNSIVGGVMGGLWTANTLANQQLFEAGKLTISNGGHIAATQFNALLVTMTGSGLTIGIVLTMLFFAKSKQFKELGRLSIGSALFNINEPITFGTPIVLNPFLLIPFVLVPTVAAAVAYIAMWTGLVPLFSGINPPWTTPPIISGFIAGGWRMAALQVVLIVISFVGYYPFVMKVDKDNLKAEQEAGE